MENINIIFADKFTDKFIDELVKHHEDKFDIELITELDVNLNDQLYFSMRLPHTQLYNQLSNYLYEY